jgi:hypothetical protein
MLNSEHSLVELGVIVLINSLVSILWSFVDHCSRTQELSKFISVELALL